jgi:hypothetical protein
LFLSNFLFFIFYQLIVQETVVFFLITSYLKQNIVCMCVWQWWFWRLWVWVYLSCQVIWSPILPGTQLCGMLNHETWYAGLCNSEFVWCCYFNGHCCLLVGLSHLIWFGLSLLIWYISSRLCTSKAVAENGEIQWQQTGHLLTGDHANEILCQPKLKWHIKYHLETCCIQWMFILPEIHIRYKIIYTLVQTKGIARMKFYMWLILVVLSSHR